MATQPDPRPDTIEPVAPPEHVPGSVPEKPQTSPDEIEPPSPDIAEPGVHPPETPPPD